MKHQKKILTVQDISGYGKCSATIALPVLSAAGHSASLLPTAVLSTHTGGLGNQVLIDLTDQIAPITTHWASIGLCSIIPSVKRNSKRRFAVEKTEYNFTG